MAKSARTPSAHDCAVPDCGWVLSDTITAERVVEIRALVRATGFFSEEEERIAAELAEESLVKGALSGYEFVFAQHGAQHRNREECNPQEGGIRGYGCFGAVPGTEGSYDLYWIVVHPEHQGRGLGSALVEETLRRVRQRGGRALYAETSGRSQYEPTRRFYERQGFKKAACFKDFYKIGDDKVVYVRYL